LAAGIADRDLVGPRFTRIFHGFYVEAAVALSPMERARAALMIFPDAFVSHTTAAALLGGIVPDDQRVHLSVAPGGVRSRLRGITAHQSRDRSGLRVLKSMQLSSPARCFCEVACDGLGLVDLVVLGDSMVGAGVVNPQDLVHAADEWTGRGAAVASRAARLVRAGVDSPMESRLRMLIVLAGLPEPSINVVIRNSNGDWVLRFDLCYHDLKLIIEYDGDHHARDPRQVARDLERREEIEEMGYRILVVVQEQHFYQEPDRTLRRIAAARLDRGAAKETCRIRSTWRNYHFRG